MLMPSKPRGTAPGLTHPGLHALAVRATVKRPCTPADGAPVLHGLFTGVWSDTELPCGWVNPGPTARGSRRQASHCQVGLPRRGPLLTPAHGPGVDDPAADSDKDGRISLWEAFAYASTLVKQYYEQRGQLSTERPVLDDTGDGVGKEAAAPER